MANPIAEKIYLKDYTTPLYQIPQLELHFDLFEDRALVTNHMQLKGLQAGDLSLNGENLKLVSLQLNGKTLTASDYQLSPTLLEIKNCPAEFSLTVVTEIEPQKNTALEGLYKSGTGFCTQNEPQGFRKITYFLDRPDVMSSYTCTITADKTKYPILLSNGNCISNKDLASGRHQATWQDPWPKPCYLFALVAGDYGCIKQDFITMSGKKVSLEVYCQHGQEPRCQHALASLAKSMKWDEEKYGREYDLDRYMILSVDDFNAGAMENKGLNIFNSRLVLASPTTATDADYDAIESVVAHEYFHNWTGNRVTLRDWFHLSLKEGLTVFRDQQFSSDQTDAAVKRIEDVQGLRAGQFTEDAGPNAHPVRPSSVIAVDNFFTSTIYEKGSEVIRMIWSMIGPDLFRKGMDLYFARHDGQAVTIENFVNCFEEVSKMDLTQFRHWYEQAGTPLVKITDDFDATTGEYHIRLSQKTSPTPQQPEKPAFHIPIKVGLLDAQGKDLDFTVEGETTKVPGGQVLHLRQALQTFTVKNLKAKPQISPLRDFSAPINLDWQASSEELLFISQHDSDGFNRWEAGQKLLLNELLDLYGQHVHHLKRPSHLTPNAALLKAVGNWIEAAPLNPALAAKLLSLPSQDYFLQKLSVFDPQLMSLVYVSLETAIAETHRELIAQVFSQINPDPKNLQFSAVSSRALYSKLLRLMVLAGNTELARDTFLQHQSMTLDMAALFALNETRSQHRQDCFLEFFNQWKTDAVVLNKYFRLLASFEDESTLSDLQAAMQLPEFRLANPNNCYALLGTFGWNNLLSFHKLDGSGYRFMKEQLLKIDKLNPQVAARLSSSFDPWKKLPQAQKQLVEVQLQEILAVKDLSKNTLELIKNAYEN